MDQARTKEKSIMDIKKVHGLKFQSVSLLNGIIAKRA